MNVSVSWYAFWTLEVFKRWKIPSEMKELVEDIQKSLPEPRSKDVCVPAVLWRDIEKEEEEKGIFVSYPGGDKGAELAQQLLWAVDNEHPRLISSMNKPEQEASLPVAQDERPWLGFASRVLEGGWHTEEVNIRQLISVLNQHYGGIAPEDLDTYERGRRYWARPLGCYFWSSKLPYTRHQELLISQSASSSVSAGTER